MKWPLGGNFKTGLLKFNENKELRRLHLVNEKVKTHK